MNKSALFLLFFLGFIIPVFCVYLPAGMVHAATGTINSTNKYAWSSNLGWINFGCASCNVSVSDTAITGYAWSANYGWINLNPTNGGVHNTAFGVLSGYAWGQNAGWINFSGTSINCSGIFIGSANGDVAGTVNFSCTEAGCPVTTNWTPSAGCGGDGGGGVDVFHNECNIYKQCISASGSGTDQCESNADCAVPSHNECNLKKQCVLVDGAGLDLCQTDNDCLPASHNECNLQNQCVPVAGIGSDLCQVDIECSATYSECLADKCVVKKGLGISQCQRNQDCQSKKHNECNAQSQCVVADGDGPDLCQTDQDCTVSHYECDNFKCISVAGVGINQCNNDNDCQITGKHNECNGQHQCVSVSGEGQDKCQTNQDCEVVPAGESHTECNAQNQCVAVNGAGSDKCKTNTDCSGSGIIGIVGIIKEPGKTIESIAIAVEKQIPEPVKFVVQDTKKIIETPQGSAITKTISTTGLAVVTVATASSLIAFPFLDIFLIILRLFGLLLTAFGLKKRFLPWGVVYDSVTKQPLDPAYVVLKNIQGKEASSAITDLDGRYGFLVAPGVYQIQANKTNYIFPSQKLAGRIQDELYADLYFGENIEVKESGETIIKNIPLDPVKFDWNEFAKKNKNLMRFYSKWDIILRKIYDFFFVIGFIVAIIAYVFAPYPYNLVIIILYLVLLVLRIFGLKPKAYGYIIDKTTGIPLSFAIVRVMMPGSDREITSKPADKYGKYYCLVSPGKYYVKIEKKNDDGSYSLIYTSQVIDVSKKGIIKEKFKV